MAGMKLMGCGCCFGDGSTSSHALGGSFGDNSVSVYGVIGDGVSAPIYSGAVTVVVTLASITELGAGALVVGFDAENLRWICQRTNGEVWTISKIGDDPVLLWGTSSDAGGETLKSVIWHESWGVACAKNASQRFSLDSNGDYIISPYGNGTANPCVDPDGNVYHRSGDDIYRNNVVFGDAPSSVTGETRPLFHDGTSVYAAGGVAERSFFEIIGVGSVAVETLDTEDIAAPGGAIHFGIWNARLNRLHLRFKIGVGANNRVYRCRLDASDSLWLLTTAGSQIVAGP